MSLRLSQIPDRQLAANELSRPQAREAAREGRLLVHRRTGTLYEIDSPDMVGWAPWNRLDPVTTSRMSEREIHTVRDRRLECASGVALRAVGR